MKFILQTHTIFTSFVRSMYFALFHLYNKLYTNGRYMSIKDKSLITNSTELDSLINGGLKEQMERNLMNRNQSVIILEVTGDIRYGNHLRVKRLGEHRQRPTKYIDLSGLDVTVQSKYQ